jgi:hypothetical protein
MNSEIHMRNVVALIEDTLAEHFHQALVLITVSRDSKRQFVFIVVRRPKSIILPT